MKDNKNRLVRIMREDGSDQRLFTNIGRAAAYIGVEYALLKYYSDHNRPCMGYMMDWIDGAEVKWKHINVMEK